MSSVLCSVRKRKKARRLGRVDVVRREDYGELETVNSSWMRRWS